MNDNVKTGILAIEDPYYLEKNIVPINDRGIFRSATMNDDDYPFLKPVVKNERFDKYVSFSFNYRDLNGSIVFERKDYCHLFSAFSVSVWSKENDLNDECLREVCRLLSMKLRAHVQMKVSNKTLFSFVKGAELKSKTPKKQDFTFHKLFEHAASLAQEPLQNYVNDRFCFWLACVENEVAEYSAVLG